MASVNEFLSVKELLGNVSIIDHDEFVIDASAQLLFRPWGDSGGGWWGVCEILSGQLLWQVLTPAKGIEFHALFCFIRLRPFYSIGQMRLGDYSGNTSWVMRSKWQKKKKTPQEIY